MKGLLLRISSWRRVGKAETLTAIFVALVILIVLLPLATVILNLLGVSTADSHYFKKELGLISMCALAGAIAWLIGSAFGSQIGSLLFKTRISHVIEINKVQKDFNLKNSSELLSFIRCYSLKVYRAAHSLKDYEDDIECKQEPLFSLYGYNPYVRAHYLSENVLCFEKAVS